MNAGKIEYAPNYGLARWATGGQVAPRSYLVGERASDLGVDHPRMFERVRKGDFMQTFSGRKFWPLDPRTDEIAIDDIAHSLSMQCRFGGHSIRFYSVAEHSVLMARSVSPENALWALLHDAAEAYLCDVPRPLKQHLPGYKEAEDRVLAAICERYGLPPEMPAEVHEADNRILADEIRQNMSPMDWHARHSDGLGVTLRFWAPQLAKEHFLWEFGNLMGGRDAA